MKKRFKKLDAIAAALLVGTVATMAIAQVGIPPIPSQQPCPGGTHTFADGTIVAYDPILCPWDTRCAVSATFVAPAFYFVFPYCGPIPQ